MDGPRSSQEAAEGGDEGEGGDSGADGGEFSGADEEWMFTLEMSPYTLNPTP